MLSRSALWVYFPLQELLASDADIGVVRMRRVSIHIHYHSTTMAAHVLHIYREETTSHSRRIVEFVAWRSFGLSKPAAS